MLPGIFIYIHPQNFMSCGKLFVPSVVLAKGRIQCKRSNRYRVDIHIVFPLQFVIINQNILNGKSARKFQDALCEILAQ